jgi:hypothetical protein
MTENTNDFMQIINTIIVNSMDKSENFFWKRREELIGQIYTARRKGEIF